VENVTILLYEEDNDSIPFKGKPTYFVKTSKNGSYNMQYLKAGKYKIIALLDENNNYQFNPKNESIGFMENQIEIPRTLSDTLENRLILFQEDVKKQFVSSKKYVHRGRVDIVMNRTSDNLVIKGIDGLVLNPDWINYSSKKDSIEFWVDSNATKNKSISILVEDKTNDFSDTIKIPITTPKKAMPLPFVITNNAKKGLDNYSDLSLLFNKPLASIDTSKIKLELRDEEIPFAVTQNRGKEIVISSAWQSEKTYVITIYPKAFTNMFDESTDTISFTFKYKGEKDYGKLLLNMEVEEGDYILQLLQEGYMVTQKTFSGNSYKYNFNQLNLGKYQLKLIYDRNNNGKWDTGEYLKHLQPERVEYYNGEISIRQGWDVDVTWKIK